MKKLFIFSLSLILSIPLFAQLPWSTPQFLCDTTGDNRNPAFVRNFINVGDYNILIWERDFGSHSTIFMKNFADPDSEIAVNPFMAEGFSQQPKGSNLTETGPALLVWQSNESGNFELYSILFENGQFKNFQQVTNNPLDDVNAEILNNHLVWERDGSIYYRSFSLADSTWLPETLIDSIGCANPVIGTPIYLTVVYEKAEADSHKIFMRVQNSSGEWQPPQSLFTVGDNRNPSFEVGSQSNLLFQHRQNSDWNVMNYSFNFTDTHLLDYSSFDEINPVGADPPFVTRGDFLGPSLVAFESNLSGNLEIYSHDMPWDYDNIYNLSQSPAQDTNLIFSDFAFAEASFNNVGLWLAWESRENGSTQIKGSFTEVVIGDVNDTPDHFIRNFSLHQNYPNPFNPTTVISYQLPEISSVNLTIFNILGQSIRVLVNSRQGAGAYQIEWDGTDNAGRLVGSGVYVYRLQTQRITLERKMLLLR